MIEMFHHSGSLFCIMMFMHIVDDYYLQGILATLKQKSWWEENCPHKRYKHDYKVALVMHAFSWSFLTMLPLAIYHYDTIWIAYLLANTLIHAFVDDMKANKKLISLLTDQYIHFCQICWSLMLYLNQFGD